MWLRTFTYVHTHTYKALLQATAGVSPPTFFKPDSCHDQVLKIDNFFTKHWMLKTACSLLNHFLTAMHMYLNMHMHTRAYIHIQTRTTIHPGGSES